LLATALCVASIALPGALSATQLIVVLPLLALLVVTLCRLGVTGTIVGVLPIIVVGLVCIFVISLPSTVGPNAATENAIGALACAGIGSIAIVLTTSATRFVLLVVTFVVTTATIVAVSPDERVLDAITLTSTGWVACAVVGAWLGASVPRVMTRIENIGLAYRAERLASASEAQRRQEARLLHDTVLSTLTLLAHSGMGVRASALRQQAADDAQLLKHVRLGTVPDSPCPDGHRLPTTPSSTPGDASDLSSALDVVRRRFSRLGLSVHWHGPGQILLPRHTGDAFLLALTECLENARRHSGVGEAHVTITHDETTVRAIVTDAGIGFDLADVERDKMGFAESVVARLHEVGGKVRLFSSPGSGTTVVLEAPR